MTPWYLHTTTSVFETLGPNVGRKRWGGATVATTSGGPRGALRTDWWVEEVWSGPVREGVRLKGVTTGTGTFRKVRPGTDRVVYVKNCEGLSVEARKSGKDWE